MSALRKLVSKKKRRFEEDGFDLDLSYVTEKIVAMGFPSESMERVFRNSLNEVKRLLEDRHADHYKIYNLCSEKSYDVNKFHGRVAVYPFDDHSPPEFSLILPFCRDVETWLALDPGNIAVVHCKAGKGRTGLMICSYLLYSGRFSSAPEVLEFYGSVRTSDSNGVTIPSQRRYVDYFATKLRRNLQYSPTRLRLTSIELRPPPVLGLRHHYAHLQLIVHQALAPPYQSEVYTVDLSGDLIKLQLPTPLLVQGDIKISIYQKINVDLLHLATKPKFVSSGPNCKLLHFWVNSFFVNLGLSSLLTHDFLRLDKEDFSSGRRKTISSSSSSLSPQAGKLTGTKKMSLSRAISAAVPIANRFAALELEDGSGSPSPYRLGVEEELVANKDSGTGIKLRLAKVQVDKAVKDTSNKFPEDFSVVLNLRREYNDERNPGIFGEGWKIQGNGSGSKIIRNSRHNLRTNR